MEIDKKQSVMGVVATAAKPDFRGFMVLATLIALPTGALLFGIETVIRWAFQML